MLRVCQRSVCSVVLSPKSVVKLHAIYGLTIMRMSYACSALQTKNILIAVGGKPYVLPIPGAEHTITSDEALELAERPQKITGVSTGQPVEFVAGPCPGLRAQAGLSF